MDQYLTREEYKDFLRVKLLGVMEQYGHVETADYYVDAKEDTFIKYRGIALTARDDYVTSGFTIDLQDSLIV